MAAPAASRRRLLFIPIWLLVSLIVLAAGLYFGYRWPEITATIVLLALVRHLDGRRTADDALVVLTPALPLYFPRRFVHHLGNTRVAPGRQLRPMFTRPTRPAYSAPRSATRPALDHPGARWVRAGARALRTVALTMGRLWTRLSPLLGLLLFAAALWVLNREVRHLSLHSLSDAIRSLPRGGRRARRASSRSSTTSSSPATTSWRSCTSAARSRNGRSPWRRSWGTPSPTTWASRCCRARRRGIASTRGGA